MTKRDAKPSTTGAGGYIGAHAGGRNASSASRQNHSGENRAPENFPEPPKPQPVLKTADPEKLAALRETLRQAKEMKASQAGSLRSAEHANPAAPRPPFKMPPPSVTETKTSQPGRMGAETANPQIFHAISPDEAIRFPKMFYAAPPPPKKQFFTMQTMLAVGLPALALLGTLGFFTVQSQNKKISPHMAQSGTGVYSLADRAPTAETPSSPNETLGHMGLTQPVPITKVEDTEWRQTNKNVQDISAIASEIEGIVGNGSVTKRRGESNSASQDNYKIAQGAAGSAPQLKNHDDRKIKALTDEVVNALITLKENANTPQEPLQRSVDNLRDSLMRLVREAQSQGRSRSGIEAIVREAFGGREESIPGALKNPDGSLNISALLGSLVKRAIAEDPSANAENDSYLAMLNEEGQRTYIVPVTETKDVTETKVSNGVRYVVVKPGDTLSSIAYRLYGDAFLYPKLFKANRKLLKTPNSLQVGMKLVVPD